MTSRLRRAARMSRRAITAGIVSALAASVVSGPASAATAPAANVKYYVVGSAYQGAPEFLYEIAQRFLGDGNRATDVFNLNKGRTEPDGGKFTTATVIEPGWYLELPPEAAGPGLITGAVPKILGAPNGLSTKYYVVRDGYNKQPEFLYEIAQRFLGNGNRATDVFNLNKGRVEPDGVKVSNPAVIKPGWYLQLPADAKGDSVITAPMPDYATTAAKGGGDSGNGSAPSAVPSAAATGAAQSPAATVAPPNRSSSNALPLILGIVVAVLLLAAGIWWALRRGLFTRPRGTRLGKPKKSQPAAMPRDDAAAWTIDRVLRTLATACARTGRSVPGVGAVVVNADTLALRLTAPDESAPDGWTAEQQGRTWSAPLRTLQSAPVDDALEAPYPRLVSAGDSDQGRVLLNLAAAHGLICLDGDSRLARALAADWAAELANSPWSRGLTVLRVGFADRQGETPNGVESAANLDAAAELLDEAAGGVLMLAHPPAGRETERVTALTADPDARWTILVVGALRNANWRLTADSAGGLETGLFSEPIRLHSTARRLTPA